MEMRFYGILMFWIATNFNFFVKISKNYIDKTQIFVYNSSWHLVGKELIMAVSENDEFVSMTDDEIVKLAKNDNIPALECLLEKYKNLVKCANN